MPRKTEQQEEPLKWLEGFPVKPEEEPPKCMDCQRKGDEPDKNGLGPCWQCGLSR